MERRNPGPERALQQIRQYCAYQERSHFETREKLYSYGLYKSQVEEIMATLVEDNFLNEERFAMAYAGGKFRMKHWGRIKIRQGLILKKVSSYCIGQALASIDEDEYRKTLVNLAGKKAATLKKDPVPIRQKKIIQYLMQKGFEYEIITDSI